MVLVTGGWVRGGCGLFYGFSYRRLGSTWMWIVMIYLNICNLPNQLFVHEKEAQSIHSFLPISFDTPRRVVIGESLCYHKQRLRIGPLCTTQAHTSLN